MAKVQKYLHMNLSVISNDRSTEKMLQTNICGLCGLELGKWKIPIIPFEKISLKREGNFIRG